MADSLRTWAIESVCLGSNSSLPNGTLKSINYTLLVLVTFEKTFCYNTPINSIPRLHVKMTSYKHKCIPLHCEESPVHKSTLISLNRPPHHNVGMF